MKPDQTQEFSEMIITYTVESSTRLMDFNGMTTQLI